MPQRVRSGASPRKSLWAWLFVWTLFALCAVLGILEYRAIVEVSVAARERLRSSLEASLIAFSQDFDSEISAGAGSLVPDTPENAQAAQNAFAALYARARQTPLIGRLFSRIAMAIPQKQGVELRAFDLDDGVWKSAEWPAGWAGVRRRIEFAPLREGPSGNLGPAFEVPLFGRVSNQGDGRGFGSGRRPSAPSLGHREVAWLIFEVNVAYLRDNLLPETLQRRVGTEYQAEVVTRTMAREIVYRSDPDAAPNLERTADASVSFFDPQMEMFRHPGPPGMRNGGGPGRGPSPEMCRWTLFVRHRAGSLEAVVAQVRRRSMAVTAGVLLMLAATLGSLIRYTRRAQTLAGLQMEFVAGVSHELRTPLTVIHTAAYNLRGKVAANPAHVERYGALIQRESGRLKDLVEQVLRFAAANAGHVTEEREPLAIAAILDEAIDGTRPLMETAGCRLEKRVDADLPAVMGDPVALRHALENLLANAARYGCGESRWIGVGVSKADGVDQPEVEIRVTDRGPGIPAAEQKHVFDPFFRGARAVADQVHGTGLGLTLVKRIVEAHGGTIRVMSEPMRGAEFLVRLPATAIPAVECAAVSPATPADGTPAHAELPGAAI